jgi:hypothetical protein
MLYYLEADTQQTYRSLHSGWRANLIVHFHLLTVLALRGTERFGVVVTLLTRIQEMLGSNHRRISWFSSVLQAMPGQSRLGHDQPPPDSSIILPFESIYCDMMPETWNGEIRRDGH